MGQLIDMFKRGTLTAENLQELREVTDDLLEVIEEDSNDLVQLILSKEVRKLREYIKVNYNETITKALPEEVVAVGGAA